MNAFPYGKNEMCQRRISGEAVGEVLLSLIYST